MNENVVLRVESYVERCGRMTPMTTRLMVVCLGGLAGAGALVCCDMDEETEALETQAAGDAANPVADEPTEAESAPIH